MLEGDASQCHKVLPLESIIAMRIRGCGQSLNDHIDIDRCGSSGADRSLSGNACDLSNGCHQGPAWSTMLCLGPRADQDMRTTGARSTPPATGLGSCGSKPRGYHADVSIKSRSSSAELHSLLGGKTTAYRTTGKVSIKHVSFQVGKLYSQWCEMVCMRDSWDVESCGTYREMLLEILQLCEME